MMHAHVHTQSDAIIRAARVSYEDRKRLLLRSQESNRRRTADVGGHEFVVHAGVFSPAYFESTSVFAELIDVEKGERFLEIGSGCGAIAVLAALRGAGSVVASDITSVAVANTADNAEFHGVDDRVTVTISDVYNELPRGYLFDTIFWNSPWVVAPEGVKPESQLELSITDPGYEGIARFLEEGHRWLVPNGRILLGFANFGDKGKLDALTREAGLAVRERRERPSNTDANVDYSLYEFELVQLARAVDWRAPTKRKTLRWQDQ